MNLWRNSLKWLYPGLRLKRWIGLGFVGLIIFLVGMGVIIEVHAADSDPLAVRIAKWVILHAHVGLHPGTLGAVITIIGGFLCLFALGKLIASLTNALDPDMAPGDLVDVIYSQRKLAQGRRIVVIGGGTGLSTMLRGLKKYSANITAIVTVADDGGSSGKLQKQLNILPPGDIRNCLVALADDETQMTELFQYRFRNSVQPESAVGATRHILHASAVETLHSGSNGTDSAAPKPRPAEGYGEGLRDHAFGNLLIAAMTAINGGDFERAILETSRVLNVRGRVLPSTVEHVKLCAEMADGSYLEGETTIANSPLQIRRIYMVPDNACPVEAVPEAIRNADVIVLGPGSVFTSIIPNLLVKDIAKALTKTRAKRIYACNVMTQPGETDNFSAFDHVKTLENHAGGHIFDYVLVNTGRPTQELLEKYRKTGSVLVEADLDRIRNAGYRPIPGNFIDQTDVVRHDANLLAVAIMDLLK